ncbi:MAG: 2,3-diphosphoglycerate-dependent phosphoglycerate mutase [Bacilli bacterium]|nr:2,3-diphosphoglycerate-dependent phosphoglycerate mutase [Bacilli bacterium]
MIKLVIVRHGESVWNKRNLFTGWTDVDLSETGIKEAHEAGKLLKEKNYKFDIAFTSVLKRANHTLDIILDELNENIPIFYSWHLNERHYGALQGLNKEETRIKYGDRQVHIWRRSYDVRPPKLDDQDERYLEMKEKYTEYIPHTECLKDTIERVIPYYEEEIVPYLKGRKQVIIVAHGNSLRGLIKYLDNISDEDIINLEIPTGKPIIYELDDNLQPIKHYYLEEK